MKVLHVIESTATGVLAMASALANDQAAKHEVEVIYSRRDETPSALKSFFNHRVTLLNVQMVRPVDWLFSIFRLRRQINRFQPDAVFLHSSIAGFLGRLSLLLCSKQSKVFYIPHCISFLRQDIGVLKRAAFVAFERIACIKHVVYLACSHSELTSIKRSLPGTRCELVENAVKIDARFALAHDLAGESRAIRRVITVGQIRRQKSPEGFAALARVVMMSRSDVHFVWIGDGDPTLKTLLLDAGVQVLGWLPKQEVLAQLIGADVYVSTSLWEGLPVSVLEAMYVGLPLLVSNCEGNSDVVRHGATGYVYGSLDAAGLYLGALLAQPEVAKQFRDAAFEDFKRRFLFEVYSARMDQLLQGDAALSPV